MTLLLAGAISDDENETTDDHRAVRSHASDPKSWTDSESESEMEVKNKVHRFHRLLILFYSWNDKEFVLLSILIN